MPDQNNKPVHVSGHILGPGGPGTRVDSLPSFLKSQGAENPVVKPPTVTEPLHQFSFIAPTSSVATVTNVVPGVSGVVVRGVENSNRTGNSAGNSSNNRWSDENDYEVSGGMGSAHADTGNYGEEPIVND